MCVEMGGAQKIRRESYPGSPKQTRFLMDGWMDENGDFQAISQVKDWESSQPKPPF